MEPTFQQQDVTIDSIVEAVAAVFRLPPGEVWTPNDPRGRAARQAAIYVTRKLRGDSFPCLGREFEVDHSTAQHAVKRVAARMAVDPAFVGRIERVERRLLEPLPPPDPPSLSLSPTVAVRVCIITRADGSYVAVGAAGQGDDQLRALAASGLGVGVGATRVSWATISVPLPLEDEIVGFARSVYEA